MAQKKAKKPVKALGKKELKRTKGGISFGMTPQLGIKLQTPLVGGIVTPPDNKIISPRDP